MTLIEVLIAVTLVSLLAVAMLFAIRAGFTALDATHRRIAANRRALGAQRILEQQVAGFLPVLARCGASPVSQGGEPVMFFQGAPALARFVTTYSIEGAARGRPQIVELFVVPRPEGGLRLVVNETPYTGPAGAGFFCLPPAPDPAAGAVLPVFSPPQAGPRSFVLADQLAYCRFAYLQDNLVEPPVWTPVWRRADLWPAAIRIEMGPLEPDPARVPPMTFTGIIRPNRLVGEQYVY